MNDTEKEVTIVSEEIQQNSFEKWVSDITMMVTPIVQNMVSDKLKNDNEFLKMECHCCKTPVIDGATELNVFTGQGFSRYLFCDKCTQRILDMKP